MDLPADKEQEAAIDGFTDQHCDPLHKFAEARICAPLMAMLATGRRS
jgi:hypothetical protein